jgi:hypothetical protein
VTSSQYEDRFARTLRAVAVMIARLLGLRAEGRVDLAGEEIAGAYTTLLGPDADLILSLDSASGARLIGSGGGILMLARLLHEDAEIRRAAGREGSDALDARAIEYALEASRRPGDADAAMELIREIRASLPGSPAP